jgi:hypothetical protein
MQPSYGNTHCCRRECYILGKVRGVTLEEPAAVILHGGVYEGGEPDGVMVDLSAHEAGNGGQRQGTPTTRRAFLYSEACFSYTLALA